MQERRGRSHPPQCTTSREDRQIMRMEVTDQSDTSRTVAQHIESVTHHSVCACTIRRRLQQSGLSARRPLLGLSLKQNHRCLRRQWQDRICLLTLAVALLFATTSSPRPSLATLFLEARPYALVSSLATFFRLTKFPQVVFSVGIRLSSSKKDAADCKSSVVTIDEPCATVTWTRFQ
ncbi:transposable element Tcb1 transposase [Trichonephila clavipes]|nr:transposable element Tcb1 transposase [Trichonephila clavipes]